MCLKLLYWILLFSSTSFSTSLDNGAASDVRAGVGDVVVVSNVSYVLLVLACTAILIYCSMIFFMISSVVIGKTFLYRPSTASELGDAVPGVSIIKPLMGVDSLLEHNVESHFKLTYPKFELLFCFHDKHDPALALVRKLSERYPTVDTKIFIGGDRSVVNPMVQNMAPAYDKTSYDFVWISTSRIEVTDEIVYDMATKLQQPKVSLVHQIPFTTDSPGFGSAVEKVYFGSAMIRFYISFNALGLCCVTGMSYMFKKSLLEETNGLIWFGRYLAEDFFLTRALHSRGELVMSAIPAQQNVGQTTVSAFLNRMVRWIRLRINMMTLITVLLEPVSDCFPLGIWTSWALYHIFSINPFYFFIFHIISWMLLDFISLCNIQNDRPPFSKFDYVKAWTVRELLSTFSYVVALANPQSIQWGKRKFKVKYGGFVEQEGNGYSHDL